MESTVQVLLGNLPITRMISRIKTPMQRFQSFLGMLPGGPARESPGGKVAAWDIFDRTRNVAQLRPPVTGPSNVAPHPIGQRSATMLRWHEKIHLEDERIFRTRPQGAQFGTIDRRGRAYLAQQSRYLGQRFSNGREFAISRMLRGEMFIELRGMEWIPSDSPTNGQSGANLKIDFGMPDENKDRIKDINDNDILTDWGQTTALLHSQLLLISQVYERNHGYPLRHVWMNSTKLDPVMRNDQVKELAGSANTVFNEYNPTGLRSVEGIEDTGYNIVLKGIPWLTWHIYDAGLDVGASDQSYSSASDFSNYNLMIPDDRAIFMPDPDPAIASWHEGSEIVRTNVTDGGTERFGLSGWTTPVIDPSGSEMKSLEIGLPVNYIVRAFSYGNIGA